MRRDGKRDGWANDSDTNECDVPSVLLSSGVCKLPLPAHAGEIVPPSSLILRVGQPWELEDIGDALVK
jgi:hypothetical protein